MRSERFDTPGELTLDVRVPQGSIEIESVDGTATEVELHAGGSDAQRLLDDAQVELRERPGEQEVLVRVGERKRFGFSFGTPDVRVLVRAPHGANLRVDAASADLRGRGRFGSLDANTASGDIDVDELAASASVNAASGDVALRSVGGDVAVNSASGDVELGRVIGDARVKTASGEVTIRDAAGDVEISTASGDQRVDGVTRGSVRLQSASGDIRVAIRKGSNVWLDVRSMGGDTTSELELEDAPPPDDEAPLVELRAISMSGDVTVARAAASADLTA